MVYKVDLWCLVDTIDYNYVEISADERYSRQYKAIKEFKNDISQDTFIIKQRASINSNGIGIFIGTLIRSINEDYYEAHEEFVSECYWSWILEAIQAKF